MQGACRHPLTSHSMHLYAQRQCLIVSGNGRRVIMHPTRQTQLRGRESSGENRQFLLLGVSEQGASPHSVWNTEQIFDCDFSPQTGARHSWEVFPT